MSLISHRSRSGAVAVAVVLILAFQVGKALGGNPVCIAGGAAVLLANHTTIPIERLVKGMWLETSKGDTQVLALHGAPVAPEDVPTHILHFPAGSIGAGFPYSPLTVTRAHGFKHPITNVWRNFGEEAAAAAPALPKGTVDGKGSVMVYNVALDTDDERSIIVAGMQLGSWIRTFPDRWRMPVLTGA